jgi:threonine dehydratase
MKFTVQEVFEAYDRIKPYLPDTPLAESVHLGDGERRYFFKLENLQPVKSFKVRGALNKMLTLTDEEKARGVATVSSGNHGTSVAYAARMLGIEKADIIIPGPAPRAKEEMIKFFGGNVMRMGFDYDSAHKEGMKYIEEKGMTYIDAYYDDFKIYGGQGTIACEILRQNPEIDTIVIPVGGGGLSTGIAVAAKAIKPEVRIIGVQTEACPAFIKAFEDNVLYEEYPITGDTICDATVGGCGKLAYEMLPEVMDDIIEIKESTVRKAVKFMIKEERFIAEGGSCLTIAAVMDHRERIGGKNIALVISGGNIDGDLMVELLNE